MTTTKLRKYKRDVNDHEHGNVYKWMNGNKAQHSNTTGNIPVPSLPKATFPVRLTPTRALITLNRMDTDTIKRMLKNTKGN